MSDVSVIIVNWNTRKLLIDCLRSLYAETKRIDLEVIVVDNASADDSVPMVKKEFPQVILVENDKNYGFARANNIGLTYCHGKYVFLLNSDTIVLDEALDKMFAHMETHPEVGILSPAVLTAERKHDLICRRYPSLWRHLCETLSLQSFFPRINLFGGEVLRYFKYDRILDVDAMPGCSLMARASAVAGIGGLDERYFFYVEDIDWCRRFKNSGWKVRFFPAARIIHYGRTSALKVPLRTMKNYINAYAVYWQKYYGKAHQKLYLKLAFLNNFLRYQGYSVLSVLKNSVPYREKAKNHQACYQWISHASLLDFKE